MASRSASVASQVANVNESGDKKKDGLLGDKKEDEEFEKEGFGEKPGCIENMTPFILLIGLGTHAIFEGLALGLATKWSSVIPFAIAIWLHKGAAGMSLGISMAKTFPNDKKFSMKMIVLFGIFTPVGVSLGMILASSGSEMIEMTFACLAAGSFLYIACSEVIIEEFSISSYRFTKLGFFFIGVIMISMLHYLPEDAEPCGCDTS